MKVQLHRLALAGAFTITLIAASKAADPAGIWLVEQRNGIVRIGDCELIYANSRGNEVSAAPGTLCGVVVWLKEAIDPATGLPPVDANNTDPAKRGQPILGMQVIFDMRPSAVARRWDGRVYNMDDGRIYDGSLILEGESGLRVQGCFLFICRSEAWTRQPLSEPPSPARVQRAR